jgi:signal transduction histidine kinase
MIASLDRLHQPPLSPGQPAGLMDLPGKPLAADQIGSAVAHELNNVFTIIRGYADHLLIKHRDKPELRAELKLISENARRAEHVVRTACEARRNSPSGGA